MLKFQGKKDGDALVKEFQKSRFFIWFLAGAIKYEPDWKHLRIWLDGCKN